MAIQSGFLRVFAMAAVLLAWQASGQEQKPPEPNWLRPEVRWNLPWPDSSKPAAGYRVLEGVEHIELYHANEKQGVYSHHAQIAFHEGTYFAMWSNHLTPDEDGPGQRVLGSLSRGGREWRECFEVFPPTDQVATREQRGDAGWGYLTAGGWAVAGDKVYGFAQVHDTRGGKGLLGRIAREVRPDGGLGPIFWLIAVSPEPISGFEKYPNLTDPAFTAQAMAVIDVLNDPLRPLCADWGDGTTKTYGLDGQPLTEPTAYRRADGVIVKIWRDRGRSKTKRLYVSLSPQKGYWTPPVQTNIPNSPSKTTSGTLPDGRTFLIGNLVTGHDPVKYDRRDPLVLALSWDGMNFDWAGAIRAGAPPLRFSTLRGPGFAYPEAVVAEGALWVIYSVDKEDIAVSRIPLDKLGPDENRN